MIIFFLKLSFKRNVFTNVTLFSIGVLKTSVLSGAYRSLKSVSKGCFLGRWDIKVNSALFSDSSELKIESTVETVDSWFRLILRSDSAWL